MNHAKLLIFALLALAALDGFVDAVFSVDDHVFSLPRHGSSGDKTTKKQSSKNTLNVPDPSRLLNILVEKGGLILPANVEEELMSLKRAVHVNRVQLSLFDRFLTLEGFRIQLPDQDEPALKIGRVSIRWDSYLKPCLYLEVDEIDVLVEFVNLLLTKSNWNELQEAGFPPKTMYPDSGLAGKSPASDKSRTASSWVRIGSIKTLGKTTVRIRSRALGRDITSPLVLDMPSLDVLNREIKRQAAQNVGGRPGCTTEDLYNVIQSYFLTAIREWVKETMVDLTTSRLEGTASRTIDAASKIWSKFKDSAKKYSTEYLEDSKKAITKELTEKNSQWAQSIKTKLNLSEGQFRRIHTATQRAVKNARRRNFQKQKAQEPEDNDETQQENGEENDSEIKTITNQELYPIATHNNPGSNTESYIIYADW